MRSSQSIICRSRKGKKGGHHRSVIAGGIGTGSSAIFERREIGTGGMVDRSNGGDLLCSPLPSYRSALAWLLLKFLLWPWGGGRTLCSPCAHFTVACSDAGNCYRDRESR